MSDSVTNGNTGQSSMSVKKEINNLHFQYLFSIAYLTPQQEHMLLEEEKRFFKHVFENQNQMFSTNEFTEFSNYTQELIKNVSDNYLKVFKDKNLAIADNDITAIENTLDVNFKSLQITLNNQTKTKTILKYISYFLICSSLLFLIRTTKRALFIFISQQPEKKSFDIWENLSYIIEYINSFIISVNKSVNNISKDLEKDKQDLLNRQQQIDKLIDQYNNCLDNINKINNEKSRLEKELNEKNAKLHKYEADLQVNLEYAKDLNKQLNLLRQDIQNNIKSFQQEKEKIIQQYEIKLSQLANNYRKLDQQLKQCEDDNNKLRNNYQTSEQQLKQCKEDSSKINSDNETLKEQLKQCKDENEKMKTDPEYKRKLIENAIKESEDYKKLFSGILNLAVKFHNLFEKWETDTLNHALISTKIMNHIMSLDDRVMTLIKKGLEILTTLYGDVVVDYKNINKGDKFVYLAKLIKALVDLNAQSILKQSEDMEVFYDSGNLYRTLVLLFEDLSGAVRVVVRVKNNQPFVGGKRKSRSYDEQTLMRKRYKTMSGGADPDFQFYHIGLDKYRMRVIFENLPDGELFGKETKEFGPFFSVHDNKGFTNKDKDITSAEDDILKSIQFDNLKMMFEKPLEDGEEVPALILYTYGYSGSGKTYTLFGKLDKIGTPTNGILWKIINDLKNRYKIKFESTSQCYGYLIPSKTNIQNVVFYDDKTGGYNQVNPVRKEIQSDTTRWSEYILGLLRKTSETDSFIKTTSNNPESSRGFLILKIGLYNDDELKGYIGVVDMAGNEDPYDIAASLCPTMDFKNMQKLIQSKLEVESISIGDFDTLYALIQDYITDIISPSIMGSILTSTFGFKKTLNARDIQALKSKTADESINFPLLHSLSNDIERLIDFLSTGKSPSEKRNTTWEPLSFRIEGSNKIVSYKVNDIFTFKNKEVIFHFNNKFILEILGLLKIKYPYPTSVSIDDLKKNIHLGTDTEILTGMKIAYAIQQLSRKFYQDYEFSLKYPTVAGKNFNIVNIHYAIKQDLIKQLQKQISFDLPYFVPFSVPNDQNDYRREQYSYNTIKRIIREGFYINKANSELIEYFDKKINLQKLLSDSFENTSYVFNGNFDYTTRTNKVKVSCLIEQTKSNKSKAELKNSYKDEKNNIVNKYNTSLLTLLTSMFPGNNKDVLITCVRDDQEYGKIKGALDTLKLVEDLKST